MDSLLFVLAAIGERGICKGGKDRLLMVIKTLLYIIERSSMIQPIW